MISDDRTGLLHGNGRLMSIISVDWPVSSVEHVFLQLIYLKTWSYTIDTAVHSKVKFTHLFSQTRIVSLSSACYLDS